MVGIGIGFAPRVRHPLAHSHIGKVECGEYFQPLPVPSSTLRRASLGREESIVEGEIKDVVNFVEFVGVSGWQ